MPQLFIDGPDGEQSLELEGGSFVFGRDPEADITLSDKKVSRSHARLFETDGAFFIEDLGSSNGVFYRGKSIRGAQQIISGAEFEIGPFVITFVADQAAATVSLIGRTPPTDGQTFILPEGELDLGRSEECAICVPDNSISRRHAVLTIKGSKVTVRDLGSSNGTFINGRKVKSETVHSGDVLRFGSIDLEISIEGQDAKFKPKGPGLWRSFRRADPSLQVSITLGVVTAFLLAVVVVVAVMRGMPGKAGVENPWEKYESDIEIELAAAKTFLQSKQWKAALREYDKVLDLDPINNEGRRGRQAALTTLNHEQQIAAAKKALATNRPQEVLSLLREVPGDSHFGSAALELVKRARTLAANQALGAARVACQKQDYRQCHEKAVAALMYNGSSTVAKDLVASAERNLKKSKTPFTPWAP